MGIRLKRQTNATATAYAGAAGGKGRRQAEEAIRLAQLQASASGGRGGTSGGGYHGGSAPTTHAQTSSAALGSAGTPISPSIQLERMREESAKELQNDQQKFIAERDEVKYREGIEADARRQAEGDARRDADLRTQKELFDYKFTQQQRREIESINNTIEEARKSGRFTPEQMEELERQAYALRMGVKPLPTLKQEPNTPNIQTDADGRKWIESAPGRWERIDDGSAQQEKQQEALRARADKYELELMKPYKIMNSRGAEVSMVRTPEEIDAIMRRKFPELYPTADTAGTGQEPPADQPDPTTAPAPTPDERKKKWGSFAD